MPMSDFLPTTSRKERAVILKAWNTEEGRKFLGDVATSIRDLAHAQGRRVSQEQAMSLALSNIEQIDAWEAPVTSAARVLSTNHQNKR